MITIRPINEADRDAFHQLVADNKQRIIDYFPITVEKAMDAQVALESIQMYNLLASKNELHVMVMETPDDKRLVGMIFIKNIDPRTSKCELAYFINTQEEGKGHTTRLVGHAVDVAFNKLGMNKVYVRVATDNTASNKVMEKAGFELEGVLKQEFRIADGSLKDLNYYGLFKK